MKGFIKKYFAVFVSCCAMCIGFSNANAQKWTNVSTGITGTFDCFTVYKDNLYAGGVDSVGSQHTNVAKWDGTKWSAMDTGQLGHVISMIAYKGKLYAGTEYTEGGLTFGRIYCWNDTTWTTLSSLNGKVTCFAIHDSILYAGGFFTMADTIRAKHITKWSDSLKRWVPVNHGGVDGKVLALASYHKKLYAGGQFNFVTCWDGKSWQDARSTGSNIMNGWVLSFATWNEELYAAGQFNYVAKWDGTTWVSEGALNDGVRSLALYNNEIYIGGDFTGVPMNDHAYHIAKFGGMNWDCVGGVMYWGGDCKPYTGTVWALCVYKDDLFVGGQFLIVAGKIMQNVAKWNKPLPGK